MGRMSVWHWLILLAIALSLFGGKGKLRSLARDVASGIESFRRESGRSAGPPDRRMDATNAVLVALIVLVAILALWSMRGG